MPIKAGWLAGAHLGFSKGKGPNFRKWANQYKTKENMEYNIFFQGGKTKLIFENLIFPQRNFVCW